MINRKPQIDKKKNNEKKALPWRPTCEFNMFNLGMEKEKPRKRGKKIKRGKLALEK